MTSCTEFSFVGYWNGKQDDWSLSSCPVDGEENVLVTVSVSEVQPGESANKYNHRKIKKKMKKVSRELRDFAVSSKKWGK